MYHALCISLLAPKPDLRMPPALPLTGQIRPRISLPWAKGHRSEKVFTLLRWFLGQARCGATDTSEYQDPNNSAEEWDQQTTADDHGNVDEG